MTAIAATMQAFFTEWLIAQRRASPHTITAYRHTLRLLLGFAAQRTGPPPCRLDIADLDAPIISAFLDHLAHQRGNPIRSQMPGWPRPLPQFAALRHPDTPPTSPWYGDPPKRGDQTIVTFLTSTETRPCSPSRTGPTGPGAVITPGSAAIQTGLRAPSSPP